MQFEELMTFTIEERGPENNKSKVLIDDKGYICGIFSTEDEAKKAIPKIRWNILRGKVNLKYATLKHMRPNHVVLFGEKKFEKRNKKR